MRLETLTRLRNAFALAAVEALDGPPTEARSAESALPFSSMTEADWRQAVGLWRQHSVELLKDLPRRSCPACGSDRSRWLFETYDGHPQHECADCGCWFVPLVVDWAVFDRLFARSPEAAALAERMMGGRDQAQGRDADLARVGGYLDELLPMVALQGAEGIRYLDTGCGVGHSLRAGLARGLTVQGVEVDPAAIALARADGLPVAQLGEPVPGGPYQLLSFWETLEHIADPLQALTAYTPMLAPGGLVAITVPNLNALATRVLRESCPWVHGGYNTPGHLNLFHPKSIERLLSRAGLTLLDADGQFSANPGELFASIAGESRGAFETLDPALRRGTLPASLATALAAVWPGVALLERLALASPILKVVACRRGEESRFAAAISARQMRRQLQLKEEAKVMIAAETDYKAMTLALQTEIDRRDALLRETVTDMGAEITRRDDLLRETVTTMQVDLDLRDRLLDQTRDELSRTIDSRARRLVSRARRVILRR